MSNPEYKSEWVEAKKSTPSRKPFSDEELQVLRVRFDSSHTTIAAELAVVIWTLLDMLEEQRGWKP